MILMNEMITFIDNKYANYLINDKSVRNRKERLKSDVCRAMKEGKNNKRHSSLKVFGMFSNDDEKTRPHLFNAIIPF